MSVIERIPEGLDRPVRKSTTSIIIHRIKIGLVVDDVMEFFTEDPEGVATVTIGNLEDRLDAIRDWRKYGVPEKYKSRAYVPYHYIVGRKGNVYQYLPEDAKGAHCAGSNSSSVGVACFGDFRRSKPTAAQILKTKYLCRDLWMNHTEICGVYGHDDILAMRSKKPKQCPGPNFPVAEVHSWASTAIKNITRDGRF
jgi:uncharacterized protein YaiE (UPF0345 family)